MTVSVTFAPTATGSRTGTLTVSAGGVTNAVSLSGAGTSPGGGSATLSASPTSVAFGSEAVGSTTAAQKVTVTNNGSALPPSAAWGTRTQTLSVLGSADGSSYGTLVGSATYTFNPATGNTVTIPLPSGPSDQYLRLSFTANSVQNGAQASELAVYAP